MAFIRCQALLHLECSAIYVTEVLTVTLPYTPSHKHAGILSSRIVEGLLDECVSGSRNDGDMVLGVVNHAF